MGTNVDTDHNIFKILFASDNHLGFLEKDSERGNDSFNTFEEILELAVENNVDFVLLGGDLFHENKPSRSSFLRCMELLKKYTFGDKQVNFDFVSDVSLNFPHLKNPVVNYQDPNLNISIPVFSIHGNHDDPSGMGQHSPLEMLSVSGLINYFGRVDNLNEIDVYPIFLTKGDTKLSLYGLSAVKDERLNRLLRQEKVKMYLPKEDTEQWFSILVLHQNHARHSLTNHIPEEFLDPFLNLVIWGHEHECIREVRLSNNDGFHVIQPGSSVATSLCEGEAQCKNAGILRINNKKEMNVKWLPLQTVRPFIFEELSLVGNEDLAKCVNDRHKKQTSEIIEDFVEDHIKNMIHRSKEQLSGHPRQPTKPLIRVRIIYEDEWQLFNVTRFGFRFTDMVANPDGIVLFRKFKRESCKSGGVDVDEDAMDNVFNTDVSQTKVEDLVEQYFAESEGNTHQLQLLSERGLAQAISQFIEKDYKDAINIIFDHQLNKTADHLKGLKDFKEDQIEEAIENFYYNRISNKVKEEEEALEALQKSAKPNKQESVENPSCNDYVEVLDDSNNGAPTRGRRGSRRGSRARGGRSTLSSRTAAANKSQLEIVE